jgi:deazaflavin-dependent oxidoreductase (nitroreductase family)
MRTMRSVVAGARTGQPRVTPLAYFRLDGKLIIVGGSWGAQSHPAWVRNLWANPSVHVEVGTESFDATARELPVAERELVWTQVVATAPVIGEYQSRTDRVIPLFELYRHQG